MISRIKNYLSVTKKEWNGMVVLIVIIALVLAAPYVIQYYAKDTTINFKDFEKAVAILQRNGAYNAENDGGNKSLTLFKFNPNNLPDSQWVKLGLSEHQAAIIKNFEAKGGRFYTKADVKKIYGITPAQYRQLAPYIDLPGGEAYTSNKLNPGEVVELNTADSAKITRIHGIGPAFAKRILEYRKRLGGFRDKVQLTEVYGMDAEKFSALKAEVRVNPARTTGIRINEVEFEQLRKFPYLTYKQANAIIQYRAQHGNYRNIDDMRDIAILDEQILRKIAPYIIFK